MDAISQKELYIQWLNNEILILSKLINERSQQYNEYNTRAYNKKVELENLTHSLALLNDKINQDFVISNKRLIDELNIKDKTLGEKDNNLNIKDKYLKAKEIELTIKEQELSLLLANNRSKEKELDNMTTATGKMEKYLNNKFEKINWIDYTIKEKNIADLENDAKLNKEKYENLLKLAEEEYNLLREKLDKSISHYNSEKKKLIEEKANLNSQWKQLENAKRELSN